MNRAVFLINNRFVVEMAKNEVWDEEKNEMHRLEPRLMKLLCLLADRPGEVVPRELIMKEIWDGYPGANEGLNQAISLLRKLLNDERKEIIATLPKTGYIFHGIISARTGIASVKNKFTATKMLVPVMAVLIVFLVIMNYFRYKQAANLQPGRLTREQAIEFSKIDSRRDSNTNSRIDSNTDAKNIFRIDSANQARAMKNK